MDTSKLRTGYASFIAIAERGGFEEPASADEWSASLVVAHLVLATYSLERLGLAIMAGQSVAYDNRPTINRPDLEGFVDASGSFHDLVAILRRAWDDLLKVAESLTAAAEEVPFPALIYDGEEVAIDRPAITYSALLNGHAEGHLPLHVRQLQALSVAGRTAETVTTP